MSEPAMKKDSPKDFNWESFNVQVGIGYALLLIAGLLVWIAFVK